MAPPGRRRGGTSPLTSIVALIFLLASTASAASAVLGVDLGTEYLKAALVKPGIPLEIVLTKDSKRKETSAVAFKPSKAGALPAGSYPERFYGGDAVALQARFPGDVYPNLKWLLGAPSDAGIVADWKARYPAVEVKAGPRGTVELGSNIFADHNDRAFSVEELLAMELKNVRDNAKALAGKDTDIEEVVFTVPPFYTVQERRALEVAAKLAGLKVLSVVSDGVAVGINYATSRTFPTVSDGGQPEVHLVFDMGAGSASATLLKFQGRQVKDVGRFNKTVQEVIVLGTGWDKTLGGDALNALIFDDMIDQFVALPAAKSASLTAAAVKSHGRAAAKLWKEAEKVRQVLSANQQTQAFFEGLYEDVDFRYKISRSQYEELAAAHAAQVDGPINQALEAAGLTVADVDSLIVHGGASRTPFVQARLEALVGKAKIKANVNSDEAAVFGAAFKAAGISPSFRVKEIRDQDTQGYTHGIQYWFNMKERDQKVFTPLTKIGATKDLPFQMMGEFEFTMYQAVPGHDGTTTKTPTLEFKSGNLTRVVTNMIDKDGCDRETFNNYVQVRLSPVTGTPEVTSAWVTCIAEVEETKGGIVDGIKGFFGGSKKDQEPLKEGENVSDSSTVSSETSSAGSSASSPDSTGVPEAVAKDGKKKKKEIRSAITYQVTLKGYEKQPRKEMKRMQDRLSAFDASDKSRRIQEEVLNSLEAFIYRGRDYLEDKSFIGASTSAVRATLEEKLSAASDWIYAEGHDAPHKVLENRLKELQDLVNPVLKRNDESSKRPAAIKELKEQIESLQGMIPMVRDQISSAAAMSSSLAAEAASKSASASPSPSSADPLADLEEEEMLTSASSEAAAPTGTPSIYDEADLKFLEETVEKSTRWLEEKEAAQKKLKETDDPAVTVKELQDYTQKAREAVVGMVTKKMRAMNQKPKSKRPKKSNSKKSKATKSAASASATPAADSQKGPSEEELREALEKAGIKGDGIKLQNFGHKSEIEDKDGNILTKLDISEDSTEEDIKAAIDRATQQGKERRDKDEL